MPVPASARDTIITSKHTFPRSAFMPSVSTDVYCLTSPLPHTTCRCYKWEQGEIPEAHARFLGLRDGVEAFSAREEREAEAPGQAVERTLYTAADGSSPSLRGGEEESGEVGQRGQRDRFITYWTEKRTGRPVRWVFFNDAYFEVSMRSGWGLAA